MPTFHESVSEHPDRNQVDLEPRQLGYSRMMLDSKYLLMPNFNEPFPVNRVLQSTSLLRGSMKY